MNYDTGEKWGTLSGATALTYQDIFYVGDNFENWNQMAMDNFTRERWTTFRYCLFVNQYDDGNGNRSSGIAENIPGQFFIVASGCIGGSDYDTALAGTFMHELGHTLGLSHGGLYTDISTSKVTNNHTNYKPNHLSIMNYTYQFSGIKTVLGDFVINYQDFKLPQIDEKHINESSGIDPEGATDGKGLTIKIPVKNKFLFWEFDDEKDASIARQSIDFNRNGTIETDVEYDLNLDGKHENLTSTLNEWNNLRFDGCLIGGYGEEINVDEVSTLIKKSELNNELDELSIDEAFEKGLLGNPGECQFDDINSKKLFAEQTKQSFSFTITNLYPESTEVKLTVSSDILSTDFTNDIDVDEDGTTVEIFVKDNLKNGDYKVSYSMVLKNGKTITETGTITIVDPNSISMDVGETENIPVDSVISCKTSNESIVEVKDSRIIAKRKGVAYITIVSTDDMYCAKITVSDNSATPIGWVLGGIALLTLLVGGGIIIVLVASKGRKSEENEPLSDFVNEDRALCDYCCKEHPIDEKCKLEDLWEHSHRIGSERVYSNDIWICEEISVNFKSKVIIMRSFSTFDDKWKYNTIDIPANIETANSLLRFIQKECAVWLKIDEFSTEKMLFITRMLSNTKAKNNENQITEEAEHSTGFIQVTNGSMNGFSVPIKDGETLYLGKDPKFANLVFTSDYKNVSRMHCAVTFDAKANRYFVTDSSSNGTYLISKKRLIKGKRTPVNINTVLILANDECTVLLG